jgi:hypothetical protein
VTHAEHTNYADTHKIAVPTLRGWKKDALSIYRAVASGHGNWVREREPTVWGQLFEMLWRKFVKKKKKVKKCLSVRCCGTSTP